MRDHDDLIQVVIDDRTAEILRGAAEARDVDIELLMVQLLIAAARHIDELLDADGAARTPVVTEEPGEARSMPTRRHRSRSPDR